MPNYGSQSYLNNLLPGGLQDILTLFNAEAPATPQASIAFGVAARQGIPVNFSFTFTFSGNPGVFEIDVEEADVNADANFLIASGGNAKVTVVSSNNVARIDINGAQAKFYRVKLVSRANPVNLTAQVARES